MGIYAGLITISNSYVNFKPLYKYEGGNLLKLSHSDIKQLIPDSEKENINLYSKNNNYAVLDAFGNGDMIALNFDHYDLEPNFNSYGARNKTGYRIEMSSANARGKILRMSDIGYYYIVPISKINGKYRTNSLLKVQDGYVYDGLKIIITLNDSKNTVLGPYSVTYREVDDQFIVKTGLEEEKYVLNCHRYPSYISDYVIYEELDEDFTIEFARMDDTICSRYAEDVITDEELLAEFKRTIGDSHFEAGKLDLSDSEEFLAEYRRSFLAGPDIPVDIQKNRLDRLTKLLSDEQNMHDTFAAISGSVSSMIVKYQDSDDYNQLIRRLLEDNDFMAKVQRFSIVRDAIETEESRLTQLKEEADRQEAENKKNEKLAEDKKHEYAENLVDELDDVIQQKNSELNTIEANIQAAMTRLSTVEEGVSLDKQLRSLKDQLEYHKQRYREVENDYREINGKIDELFNHSAQKAMEFSFNGMLSSRMLKQAAEWESEQNALSYAEKVKALKAVPVSKKTSRELADYLVERIHSVRPSYDRNTILNILICYTQNFLTVFTGEPGTGKTSICKILAATIGQFNLEQYMEKPQDGFRPERFIPVSVERGWTSKRDFVGYYNPLTKTFDRSNRQIFDCLNILNLEASDSTDMPFTILLDEANLSPMEYYWADFMNVCDQLDGSSTINLGDDYIFRIPDNLRFVATINNDHTTEALSPRLIDRAWIIRLPKVQPSNRSSAEYIAEDFEIIPWSAMKALFDVSIANITEMSGAAKDIYTAIVSEFRKANIQVSPRTEAAIKRYWSVAQGLFENGDVHASIVALDYAIAQRILPHINGSGEKYGEKLRKLADFCDNKNLVMSAAIFRDILSYGEDNMQYYQFFAY